MVRIRNLRPSPRGVFRAPASETSAVSGSTFTRSRICRTMRSRRTIALVMTFGQYPFGRAVFLHIGHRLLLSRRNMSTHSGWKM